MARNALVVASAARTETGNSGALPVLDGDATQISFLVDCTASSGTSETLDLSIDWSHDGSTFVAADPAPNDFAASAAWDSSFDQITGVATALVVFRVMAPLYRITWTIGGSTPSFTFSIYEHSA